MTTRRWSGRVARRALAAGASVLVALGGLMVAPAAAGAAGAAPAAAGTLVASVAVGADHTCALTTAGGVRCWGKNDLGQLGDGTLRTRSLPVDVVGLTSGVVQVSASNDTTCAVTSAGGVKCWGDNHFGALGNGRHTDAKTPVDVVGLSSGVSSVSVGGATVCAVTVTGGVKCWGWGNNGGLGNGATASSATPVDVVGLGSGVTAVDTGLTHACALTGTGLQCWGYNAYGELGIGSRRSTTTPVTVTALGTDVRSVSVSGYTTCVTRAGGRVSCWGQNFGLLGTQDHRFTVTSPSVVPGLRGVSSLAVSPTSRCSLGATLSCWGDNTRGSLGDGTTVGRTVPTPVVGLPAPAVAVAAGGSHSCAATGDGRLLCWGFNRFGELGTGSRTDSLTPVAVSGLGG